MRSNASLWASSPKRENCWIACCSLISGRFQKSRCVIVVVILSLWLVWLVNRKAMDCMAFDLSIHQASGPADSPKSSHKYIRTDLMQSKYRYQPFGFGWSLPTSLARFSQSHRIWPSLIARSRLRLRNQLQSEAADIDLWSGVTRGLVCLIWLSYCRWLLFIVALATGETIAWHG